MKRIIKILHSDDTGYFYEQVECEIFQYQGFHFGVYYHKGEFIGVDLYSGKIFCKYNRCSDRTPKQAVLRKALALVDSGDLQRAHKEFLQEIEARKEKLKDELYSLPVLPVNVR